MQALYRMSNSVVISFLHAGARHVPMATPATVPAAPAVVTKAPTAEEPLDGLLKKKELVWNTFTPAATQKATPAPSVPALKELLLKVMTQTMSNVCVVVLNSWLWLQTVALSK